MEDASKEPLEALNTITVAVPGWLKRLEELNIEIERRQQELAAHDTNSSPSAVTVTAISPPHGSTWALKTIKEIVSIPATDSGRPGSPTAGGVNNTPILTGEPLTLATEIRPTSGNAKPGNNPIISEESIPSLPQSSLASPSAGPSPQPLAHAYETRHRPPLRTLLRSTSSSTTRTLPPAASMRRCVYYDSDGQQFFIGLTDWVDCMRNLLRKTQKAALDAAGAKEPVATLLSGGVGGAVTSEGVACTRTLAAETSSAGAASAVDARDSLPTVAMLRNGQQQRRRTMASWETMNRALEALQMACERASFGVLKDGVCKNHTHEIEQSLKELRNLALREKERLRAQLASSSTNYDVAPVSAQIVKAVRAPAPAPALEGDVTRAIDTNITSGSMD